MIQQKPLAFTIFAGMALSNILFFFIGMVAIRFFVRLREVPYPFIAVGIIAFSAVGANAMGDINGMKMMIFFAILGFIMERFNFAVAPMILGLVLGPIIEPSFRRALMIHEYQFFEVFLRPITAGLLILSLVVTVTPIIWRMKRAREGRLAQNL